MSSAPSTTTTRAAAEALVLLEALALGSAALAALQLGIEILGRPTAGRALLVETLLVLLKVSLALGMLLLVSLRLLVSLLLNLLRVHVVPRVGAVVVGLPARSGFFLRVAVMPGI
jgi:hypothetical protein